MVAKWGKLTHFHNPRYLTFDLEWLESYNTTLYGFSRVPSPKSGTVYRHVKQSKDIVIHSIWSVSSGSGTIFQQGGQVQPFPAGGLGQSPGVQCILATIF